nr:hypothetical protein [Salipiger mangrovisoli]
MDIVRATELVSEIPLPNPMAANAEATMATGMSTAGERGATAAIRTAKRNNFARPKRRTIGPNWARDTIAPPARISSSVPIMTGEMPRSSPKTGRKASRESWAATQKLPVTMIQVSPGVPRTLENRISYGDLAGWRCASG